MVAGCELFARATGVVAIGLAIAVIFEPGLAPSLDVRDGCAT